MTVPEARNRGALVERSGTSKRVREPQLLWKRSVSEHGVRASLRAAVIIKSGAQALKAFQQPASLREHQ